MWQKIKCWLGKKEEEAQEPCKSITEFIDDDYRRLYEVRQAHVRQYAKWLNTYKLKEEKAKDFAEKVYWRMHVKETEQCLNELIRGWK